MITVKAVVCHCCKDTIYSRARHDFHFCSCGHTHVDGGFDYLKYGAAIPPEVKEIEVSATKRELYDDWNHHVDKYGLIK